MMKKDVFIIITVLLSAISCMEYESIELQIFEPANCFIVQKSGDYCFWTVRGRTDESVGDVNYVDVLWESFGTLEVPQKGDLIESVEYEDGMVKFRVPKDFKEGNAVIAVRRFSDILWSWHIWLVKDDIEEYAISAGDDNSDEVIFMDRNLGATSANPDLVTSNGLFYQFARKDPFLGVGSLNGEMAESTYSWPEAEDYEIDCYDGEWDLFLRKYPTTFYSKIDFYCTYSDDYWKDEMNPCPVGWTIPSTDDFSDFRVSGTWGSNSEVGLDPAKIDFPLAGIKINNGLTYFGYVGAYWTSDLRSEDYDAPYYASIWSKDYHDHWSAISNYYFGKYGMSIRCVKE